MRVDLPAFGNPKRPTSATTLSCSESVRASPGSPGVVRRGAWFTLDLKRVLPNPRRPPRAANRRCPTAVRSPMTSCVSASMTVVPGGTLSSASAPRAPVRPRPLPERPLPASISGRKRKSTKVLRAASTTTATSPPSPPSPPSGPPLGTDFSRRKLTAPGPPCPAATCTVASSTNFIGGPQSSSGRAVRDGARQLPAVAGATLT